MKILHRKDLSIVPLEDIVYNSASSTLQVEALNRIKASKETRIIGIQILYNSLSIISKR